MNMTYGPSLAKVKVDAQAKNQGHRSNGLAVRVLTDGHTDRQTGPILLPRPLMREVKNSIHSSLKQRCPI